MAKDSPNKEQQESNQDKPAEQDPEDLQGRIEKALKEDLSKEPTLESLSNKQIKRIAKHVSKRIGVREVSATSIHQGPLPPPRDLEKYNEIVPGSAERLLKMVEKNQQFRFNINNEATDREQKRADRGQLFGFIITILAILAAAFCAFIGANWVAGILTGVVIVQIVPLFLKGRNSQNNK